MLYYFLSGIYSPVFYGIFGNMCMCAKSLHQRLTVCNLVNYSLPGCSGHEILQARILEWVAMPSSKGSSRSRDRTCVSYVSCIGSWVIYHQRHWGNSFVTKKVKVTRLCLTLCDPMDYRVHGILQARILDCIACPFSRGSSQPRD